MFRHIGLFLAGVFLVAAAEAGGWSVVTLEEWPVAAVVSEPVEIRFTVRAHGRTLTGGFDVEAVARHEESGREVRFPGREVSNGVFEIPLEFPETGTWNWKINGYGEQAMPDIKVAASRAVVANPAARGDELFVAKGCVVCHDGRFGDTAAGVPVPRLTGPADYRGNPDFLRMWLADPQAVSPQAMMPDFDLSDEEIEILVAYLSEP